MTLYNAINKRFNRIVTSFSNICLLEEKKLEKIDREEISNIICNM